MATASKLHYVRQDSTFDNRVGTWERSSESLHGNDATPNRVWKTLPNKTMFFISVFQTPLCIVTYPAHPTALRL